MTITPFLTLKLRTKKDVVRARTRARRVAGLLSFDAHEQTCIAAGSFVIASQALLLFGQARLCFQIENHQLQIFAEALNADTAPPLASRLSGVLPELDARSLYRLTKQLPLQSQAAEELDLAWLVKKLEETASTSVFSEIEKQNQEVLALLHEIRLFQGQQTSAEEKNRSPHAA